MKPSLKIHQLTKWERFGLLFLVYFLVLVAATWGAYGLRFEFAVPQEHQTHIWTIWPWVWAAKLVVLAMAGQFSSLLSFFSLPDLKRLGIATAAVSFGLMTIWYVEGAVHEMSRTVIILDGVLALTGLCVCRLMFRMIRQGSQTGQKASGRIGIVGAGEVGAALARELQIKGGLEPVVFFDDADRKAGTQVHGIPVVGPIEQCLDASAPEFDELIIAMPSASGKRVQEIVSFLNDQELECRTVPAMSQLAAGEMVTALRPIEIGDVLGRDPVQLGADAIGRFFNGKTVLVTGAGGSIGSELCRQLIQMDINKLILLDQSEPGLFEIHEECRTLGNCAAELVDITSQDAIDRVLSCHQPQVVFHAAAYKHVALLESQAAVAVRNNVLGTHLIAKAARLHQVDWFTLVSTDKAVHPSSVMGASKYLAEQVVQGHNHAGDTTQFVTVRFGNVLGSSGSVIPIFQKQIEAGGPVTVRDPEATRFFMSIPEAAGLVLRSTALEQSGSYVLDMGTPVNIARMAEQMIRLNGKTPGDEIELNYTGLLAGEKLHEELHASDEHLTSTDHLKIQRIETAIDSTDEWGELTQQLEQGTWLDDQEAMSWLRQQVPNFRSE